MTDAISQISCYWSNQSNSYSYCCKHSNTHMLDHSLSWISSIKNDWSKLVLWAPTSTQEGR